MEAYDRFVIFAAQGTPMALPTYFAGLSNELHHQAQRIRNSFRSHRPTSGSNREAVIRKFLAHHIPSRFGIGEGIVISRADQVSNQADVVIYDKQFNEPLNSDLPAKLFLAESVFALIEVKTELTPSQLDDSLSKCIKFKRLERRFDGSPVMPAIADSLFVIFAFEAAAPQTFKSTLAARLSEIPWDARPDLIVVPGSLVAKSGHYYKIAKIGQPNSPHRRALEQQGQDATTKAIGDGFDVFEFKQHSLLVFLIWFTSWLQRAGNRAADLVSYLPEEYVWGKKV
ncbi:MAG: DUF6602 domain-containing protein [Hyphomicrobium sp.]|nr:DUF6602 domain-containing protein [Hyphomicrobium sp.]